MKTYGTYRFKDKDPIIDVVRACIEIYAALRELKLSKAIEKISKVSNVAETTIHGWLSGDTISPRFCTVAAVVRATGEGIKIGKHTIGGHRYRVIQGGRKVAS